MNTELMPLADKVIFKTTVYTFEKRWSTPTSYSLETLRKRRAEIHISLDYLKETVTVNNTVYNTRINREFTYKKAKGNVIEISSFIGFVKHLKESATHKSCFHSLTQSFLLKLSKNKFTIID